jgi:hypothetical protein
MNEVQYSEKKSRKNEKNYTKCQFKNTPRAKEKGRRRMKGTRERGRLSTRGKEWKDDNNKRKGKGYLEEKRRGL